jgi:hypothetical protein
MTKGGPAAWGLGEVLKTPPQKKIGKINNQIHVPRTWTGTVVRYKQRKRDMEFGTWNVRSLYRSGSFTAAARELARYKLDLVGELEVRWDREGKVRAGDCNFFY